MTSKSIAFRSKRPSGRSVFFVGRKNKGQRGCFKQFVFRALEASSVPPCSIYYSNLRVALNLFFQNFRKSDVQNPRFGS